MVGLRVQFVDENLLRPSAELCENFEMGNRGSFYGGILGDMVDGAEVVSYLISNLSERISFPSVRKNVT